MRVKLVLVPDSICAVGINTCADYQSSAWFRQWKVITIDWLCHSITQRGLRWSVHGGRKTQHDTLWIGWPSCRTFPSCSILWQDLIDSSIVLASFKGSVMEPCVSHHWAWRGFRADERNERCCMFTPRKTHKVLEQEEKNSSRLLRQHVRPANYQFSFCRYLPEDRRDRCNCSGSFRMEVGGCV